MLSFPAEREFIAQLREISDNYTESPNIIELIALWQKGYKAGQKFEESVAEFILKLPATNQVPALDFILGKLTGEDCWHFEPTPWWVGELTGYNKREYEKYQVAAFAGIPIDEFHALCHELAAFRASKTMAGRMDVWNDVVAKLRVVPRYSHADLEIIEADEAEVDGLSHPIDGTVFSLAAAEIAHKRFRVIVRELSKFYNSLISGHHSFTEVPHLKWVDEIQEFCTELTSEFTYSENSEHNEAMASSGFVEVPEARLKQFLVLLSNINHYRVDDARKILYPERFAESVPSVVKDFPVTLPWQGSKTELAELGYALLEAGLIGGPREAALKTLADFFGQDLGNPAKHLQTLQKRRWDPAKREPVTPLLDRLGNALKNLLKIKEVAPSKK